MIRLRLLLLVACLALVAPLLPSASASVAPPKSVDPLLTKQLASAKRTDHLTVFVHASTITAARDAVKAHGLTLIDSFRKVGVAVAIGAPAQIKGVVADSRVSYVEANQKLSYLLDTSHKATRGEELYQGFTAATGPPVCTTQRKRVPNPNGHGYIWKLVQTSRSMKGQRGRPVENAA